MTVFSVDSFIFITVVACFLFGAIEAKKIALFPSTGCFSHDVMMKQVGGQLDENDNNITWIQTYLYDFGFGEMPLPDHWNRLSIKGIDERGKYLQENTGRLIWRQNVPFDFDRPFNIQGIKDFVVMLQRHQEYCTLMMDDPRYQQLRRENVSVAVLDHFLQECMGGLAHLLNASVIQFSNWPISDGYVTSLNLPASPASVPKTGTRLSSVSMNFLQRCQNVLFHIAIAVTRFVQMRTLDALFTRKQYPWIQVELNEAQRPIFAGRSELIFEAVRPINNRIKFFGASSTMPPENYVSSLGHLNILPSTVTFSDPVILRSNISDVSLECSTCYQKTRRSWMFKSVVNQSIILSRQQDLREKYTTIDWDRVHTEKFVLVTFGSVAQVDKMHVELLESLLDTFKKQPELIIWQSNLSAEQIYQIHGLRIPSNVMVSSWVPIKELLAHENIEYIICHGGINTVNELGLFGVPVLGVPLQGDQASNLARVVDLGAAELMTIIELNNGKLDEMMEKMRKNLPKYWQRSEKLARMLAQHREFHSGYQKFWLNWVARHGKRIASKKFVRYDYLGDVDNRFWMTTLGSIFLAVCLVFH
uniref:glucuronosyltransferase n=1 Tax=Caenorhabditis japonica TaxID=281687 RepID=A0A8R1HWJ8_CAEJA